MKLKLYTILLGAFVLNSFFSTAQVITTIAGTGAHGFGGDAGFAAAAQFNNCTDVAFDGAGNIYIADRDNNVVRKVSNTGVITTIAGNGTPGYSGDAAAATAAKLNKPTNVAIDPTGVIYISDNGNNVIRKVALNGKISTYAGDGTAGYFGDADSANMAELNSPRGLACDHSGNLFIADAGNRVIRMVDSNHVIYTVAGNGLSGYSGDGSMATDARLSTPLGVAVDVNGNLYIADYFNNVIRKIDGISGIITTVAGNGGSGYSGNGGPATAGMLRYPSAISVDGSGNIFIADAGNSAIRKVSGGIISAFAGNGINGYSGDGGPAITAEFNAPSGIAVDGWDRVYVADYGNNVIRVITAATGINNIAASPDQPIVYPNPANGSFTITMPVNYEGATIIISDATGRTIFAGETKGSQQFSTHNWMPGTYFISVCSEKAIFHQAILAR